MSDPDEQEITQIMPDSPHLIALSRDAKAFESSPFGRYILDKAAEEAGLAAKALTIVNPDDKTQIIKLQNDARRLSDLMKWITEAVNIGDHEYAQYLSKVSEGE